MIQRCSAVFVFFLTFNTLMAQIGGRQTYAFLNLTTSPRVAALGGKNVSLPDSDLSMPFHNPSLLNHGMHHRMVLNYVNYFTDINYGYFSIAQKFRENQDIAFGIHYINYGSFTEADENGIKTGTFHASDYVFNLTWSRPIDSLWRIGINAKPILSVYEKYTSVGLVFDAGANYYNPDWLFSAGLVLRNIGSEIKPYYDGNYEPVPFEIIAGFTKKLRYAPFRFSVTAHQLQKPDLTYTKTTESTDVTTAGSTEAGKSGVDKFTDKAMRHFIVGVEFNPMKNFFIRAGYNYQRRKELTVSGKTGMVGFSYGFGIKINKFTLDYGRATYHLAGATNHFSVSISLDDF